MAEPTHIDIESLELIGTWPVDHVAAAVVVPDGRVATAGPVDKRFVLASVTKPLFAYACLIAIEEGTLTLDDADDEGVTVRHLLAHTSGLPFDDDGTPVALERRRVYSNVGFDRLGRRLAAASGFRPDEYLTAAVFEPLGMTSSSLEGSPAHAGVSTVSDLIRFIAELRSPTLVAPATLAEAISPQWPDLAGVVPGFGRHEPCPWGLGFELRGDKSPHWTGRDNSPATFGHFGAAGTFLWVDPAAEVAAVALTDRRFGPWAATNWPLFADALLGEARPAPA